MKQIVFDNSKCPTRAGGMKMKKLVFLFAILLFVIMALMVLVNTVFAQEDPQKKTVVVQIEPSKEGGTFNFPAPGPGENLTVIVDRPPAKKAAPVDVVPKKKADLYLRGGLGVGKIYYGMPVYTVGLVGGIGYADSPWRLRGRFDVGKCRSDNVAANGNLSAMRRLRGNFWVGAGADLLYCSDLKSHPKERSTDRFIGGSVRVAYERGHFLFEEYIRLGAVTMSVPGGRVNFPGVSLGLSASYMF